MHIRYEFSLESLFGDVDPTTEGYDAEASANEYARMLKVELENEYPEAEVEVVKSNLDRSIVDGREGQFEETYITNAAWRVWSPHNWLVQS